MLIYAAVLAMALWLNSTWAQSVPEFTDGKWVLPARGANAAPAGQYSSGWEQHAAEACAVYGCDPGYLMSIIMCESGGDPGAAAYNPSSGNMTLGLLQIDEMWGSIAYAGGVEQIWWAAAHLGSVWWACG